MGATRWLPRTPSVRTRDRGFGGKPPSGFPLIPASWPANSQKYRIFPNSTRTLRLSPQFLIKARRSETGTFLEWSDTVSLPSIGLLKRGGTPKVIFFLKKVVSSSNMQSISPYGLVGKPQDKKRISIGIIPQIS